MIKIAVPNKGSLSEAAVEILTEAGYKGRGHSKALNVVDADNGVEFFFPTAERYRHLCRPRGLRPRHYGPGLGT